MANWMDIIVALVVLVMIGAALLYIRKQKKHGAACIGCPAGCSCGEKKDGCHCHTDRS